MTNAIYNPSGWLEQFFRDFDRGLGHKGGFTPAVDILEEKDTYLLRMELPGVGKESVKIEVKENRLQVTGQKPGPAVTSESQYRYVESSHGAFSRTFELPRNVDASGISASYRDGVLELRIPKAREAMPKSIEIA